jgi:riboflavin kinase/FMN adenylyltransferase
MRHYWSLDGVYLINSWVTIGSFDGVHRGHQEILRLLTSSAREHDAKSVVLTFFPHPAVVLGKRIDPFYLTSPEEKAELLFNFGVDYVITYPFDKDVAQLSANEFMSSLQDHLNIRELIVGYDFALGHDRQGDASFLKQLGELKGFSVQTVPPFKNGNEVVSSSYIRNFLREGDVKSAATFLGRNFFMDAKVIHGDGRGRTIGIPTANLDIWKEKAIPKPGVYACEVVVAGKKYMSVTNIGYRPTFEGALTEPRVETHIINFDGDIYGSEIHLEFIERLRDEEHFPSIDALVTQIQDDIESTRLLLAE